MARPVLLSCLAIILLAAVAEASTPGVNSSTLSKSIIVTATINGQPIATDGSSSMKWGQDILTVTWKLNDSFAGQDTNYQQVWIKLCYGAMSALDRPWRKNDVDLKLSKTCKYSIARQPYTAAGNTTTYKAPDNIPDAKYFVRVFALNSTAPDASTGLTAVGIGSTTDANRTANLFHVEGFTGRNTSIVIAIVVLSVVSYALLIGYFLVERYMKKTK